MKKKSPQKAPQLDELSGFCPVFLFANQCILHSSSGVLQKMQELQNMLTNIDVECVKIGVSRTDIIIFSRQLRK